MREKKYRIWLGDEFKYITSVWDFEYFGAGDHTETGQQDEGCDAEHDQTSLGRRPSR